MTSEKSPKLSQLSPTLQPHPIDPPPVGKIRAQDMCPADGSTPPDPGCKGDKDVPFE